MRYKMTSHASHNYSSEHQRQKKAMQLMGKTSVPTTYTSLDASQVSFSLLRYMPYACAQ